MTGLRHRIRLALAPLLAVALVAQPASAQSILRDAETEAFLRDIAGPLVDAAGLGRRNVDFVLVGDQEINAFVAGGQVVYLNAGFIEAAKNVNEVEGVIAHELGHVASGDVLRNGGNEATGISLLSLVLGAAAIAAGAGDAGAGILMAGQTAAMGKYLAFNRQQEASADQSARRYLSKAGISGRGMLAFFKTLQTQEFRLSTTSIDPYAVTHPLSGDRISVLREAFEADPAWQRQTDPAVEARFQRIKAKLFGFTHQPADTLTRYPPSMATVPARYARAYAYHKQAFADRAIAETDALLAQSPNDAYFKELKGQILLESGRPKEALPVLREAVERTNYQPLMASLFGHALIATENRANYPEAKAVLRQAVARDNENPFAWYQLGVIYAQEGDQARAALASAERHLLQREVPLALRRATTAMAGIPKGTPDYLRAQDIAMVSKTQIDATKRGRRDR